MLCALLLFVAQGVGPSVCAGDHFAVAYEGVGRDLADDALEVAEASWPVVTELLGLKNAELKLPIAIELAALSGGDPKLLQQYGLTLSAQAQLVREASNGVMRDLVPNHESHPAWLAEGFASHVERTTLLRLGRFREAAQTPRYASHQCLAQRVNLEGRFPDFDSFLADSPSKLVPRETQALQALFFGWLLQDRARSETLLRAARQISGGVDYAPALCGALRRIYDGASLWSNFRDSLAALQPEWEQLSGDLGAEGGAWLQRADPIQDALAWSTRRCEGNSWVLEGEFEMLGTSRTEMSVLFGRNATRHLAVCFRTGKGISVSMLRNKSAQPNMLMARECKVELETRIAFRVEWDGERLSVFVRNKRELHMALQEAPDGPWGLGVGAGCAGLWRDVAVR